MKPYTIILGGGESGIWSIILAKREGHQVLLSDAGKLSDDRKMLLSEHDIPYEEGGHQLTDLAKTLKWSRAPQHPRHSTSHRSLSRSWYPHHLRHRVCGTLCGTTSIDRHYRKQQQDHHHLTRYASSLWEPALMLSPAVISASHYLSASHRSHTIIMW